MLYVFTLLLGALSSSQKQCLTPEQDKQLKTSIMAIDATLKITCTSLDIAAMWKTGVVHDQLVNSSRIISAVDVNLVQKMTKITEETCGTCKQITGGVKDIVHSLEDTLSAAVPEWKSNPVFNGVVLAVNTILGLVPAICNIIPAPTLKADVQCLTPDQDKKLKTSIMAIDGTLKLTVTSLDISAMWKTGVVKDQLQQASRIITAVDQNLVQKLIPITEKTCGTCAQITTQVNEIVKDLENTMTAAVPDWKTNLIFASITTAINGILGIVPAFCPTPTQFKVHQC